MSISLDYSLRVAEKHVEEYRDKNEIISRHHEAMECRDCEDFLDLGIEAYKWLAQANSMLRQAALKGIDVSAEVTVALAMLYRRWLVPCSHAEERIKQQEDRGYDVRNADTFRKVREQVDQQVRLLRMEEQLERAFQGDIFDEKFWLEARKMRSA